MKRNEKVSGIQKKYLKYTAALLGLALLLSTWGPPVCEEQADPGGDRKIRVYDGENGISLEICFARATRRRQSASSMTMCSRACAVRGWRKSAALV